MKIRIIENIKDITDLYLKQIAFKGGIVSLGADDLKLMSHGESSAVCFVAEGNTCLKNMISAVSKRIECYDINIKNVIISVQYLPEHEPIMSDFYEMRNVLKSLEDISGDIVWGVSENRLLCNKRCIYVFMFGSKS